MRIIFRALLILSRFNYFILNSLHFPLTYFVGLLWGWWFLFNNFHFLCNILSCPSPPPPHFVFFLFTFCRCFLFFSSIHFSFYNQRINVNASTCESAYEWCFSLHRYEYDLIKFKYLNHFYFHIFHSFIHSNSIYFRTKKCKKKIRLCFNSFEWRASYRQQTYHTCCQL